MAARTAARTAQIEAFGQIVAQKQAEDALVDKRAAAMKGHERAAFLALPHTVALRAACAWMHAQETSAPPLPSLEHGLPRRTPAPRTAARRPAARRSLGARSSQDPGDEGDGEPARRPPTRRAEPRHISHALRDFLEQIRPDEEVGP